MIPIFKHIKCLAEDVRLNVNDEDDVKQYKLRVIEDLCTQSIRVINDRHNEQN